MKGLEEDIIENYLSGENIDPCEYDEFSLRMLDEFLGNDEEEY